MRRLAVEDVRPEDPVILTVVVPGGPIDLAIGDCRLPVPRAVAAAEVQRQSVAVGLDYVRAERRGDDTGQARARPELQYPAAANVLSAGEHLVGQGDGGRPEADAIGQAFAELADGARLFLIGKDRAGVQDRPSLPTLAEVVLVQREVPG